MFRYVVLLIIWFIGHEFFKSELESIPKFDHHKIDTVSKVFFCWDYLSLIVAALIYNYSNEKRWW